MPRWGEEGHQRNRHPTMRPAVRGPRRRRSDVRSPRTCSRWPPRRQARDTSLGPTAPSFALGRSGRPARGVVRATPLDAFIEESDVDAAGGLAAAVGPGWNCWWPGADVSRRAGSGRRSGPAVARAVHPGRDRRERLARLAGLERAPWLPGLLPTPVGEPTGSTPCACSPSADWARWRSRTYRRRHRARPPARADVLRLRRRRLFAPIVAERGLRLGANANNPALTRKEAVTLIRGAGLAACEQLSGGGLEEVAREESCVELVCRHSRQSS